MHISLLFAASIPLAYLSILSVYKFFSRSNEEIYVLVKHTIAGVLLAHGVALTFLPAFYAFEASISLTAAAWLLWFGGLVVFLLPRK